MDRSARANTAMTPNTPRRTCSSPTIRRRRSELVKASGYNNEPVFLDTPVGRYINDKEVTEAMIPMLNAVGINAKLRTPEWATLWADVQRGRTPFYYMGRGSVVDPSVALSQYFETGGSPRIGISDPKIDQDAGRRARDVRSRRAQEGAQCRVQGDRGCGAGMLHVAASHAVRREQEHRAQAHARRAASSARRSSSSSSSRHRGTNRPASSRERGVRAQPMLGYLLRRIIATIPVVVLISLLVFLLIHAAPGDPADLLLSDEASPAGHCRCAAPVGPRSADLRPVPALSGEHRCPAISACPSAMPIRCISLIGERLPATIELAIASMLIAIIFGIPLGVWAGAKPNSWADNLGSMFGFFGISMPSFWLGIMLILVVSGYFNWLPSSGRSTYGVAQGSETGFYIIQSLLAGNMKAAWDGIKYIIMPAIALGHRHDGPDHARDALVRARDHGARTMCAPRVRRASANARFSGGMCCATRSFRSSRWSAWSSARC